MSAFHHYRELTLISCDMLLECDVIAALKVRAHQRAAWAAKRALLKQQQQQLRQQGKGLPILPDFEHDAWEVPCPLQRIQVLGCRGIDGGALEMAAIKLKLPELSVDVVCTDWRCIEKAFVSS
ncbi:hypothetical protein DUNSADRAFT_13594 [Dunaliella salina]|uniref:Encoded protein n=1 Tax=Dunaliella salina TaxID=3046 RepID=A0ABQ7H399_DUNSA|nr:hypothetical protein DUNSADRAFT_13594 [Dunaliella salina]|eukprot:KAF5841320.1 hypothetical protein DUNSADRAFT_13594 [Dunaliella salina]